MATFRINPATFLGPIPESPRKQKKAESRITDRPLATHGLTSYRYRGQYGWIMIGATSNEFALREAGRSTLAPLSIDRLEVWNGDSYVPAH